MLKLKKRRYFEDVPTSHPIRTSG